MRRLALGPATRGPSPESGFMLVGVVLFVVVLTILGLSLFGLSGFEAQFLRASNRRAESYYAAASGIERARFVMIANRPKSEVRTLANLPPGVTYSVAKQGATYATADSNAVVNWAASGAAGQIWIRATANIQGELTTLQQRFAPGLGDAIYERLFTLSGPEGLVVRHNDVVPQDHLGDRWGQTELNGIVRTTAPIRDELGNVVPLVGGFFRNPQYWVLESEPVVETPDLISYWAEHWADADSPPSVSSSGDVNFTSSYAGGAPGSPRFFKSTGSAQNGWSLENPNARPDITVQGTVIWMFEKGVQFKGWLEVHGQGSNPLLVMVARPRDSTAIHPYRTGISFENGLDQEGDTPESSDDNSPRCPMILVSDGRIEILHDEGDPGYNEPGEVLHLSVFARNAELMGPVDSPIDPWLRFQHSDDSNHDDPGGVVYELVQRGLLPNTFGGTSKLLEPIAGTWIEIPN